MNWEKIKKDCPNAYPLSLKHTWGMAHSERNLYELFDEQELYIRIFQNYTFQETTWHWAIYWYLEKKKEGEFFDYADTTGISIEYNTRQEAETSAFEEAFRLLEAKITGKELENIRF